MAIIWAIGLMLCRRAKKRGDEFEYLDCRFFVRCVVPVAGTLVVLLAFGLSLTHEYRSGRASAEHASTSDQVAEWADERYGIEITEDEARALRPTSDDCSAESPCRSSDITEDGTTINSVTINGKMILVKGSSGLEELAVVAD